MQLHQRNNCQLPGKTVVLLLVEGVDVLVAKHYSLWFLRAFDEHFDLAACCSLNV